MPPLPSLITQYIVRKELGDEEGRKIWFSNKKDHIIQHFKRYPNFLARTEEEEREEIFALLQPNIDNNTPKLIPQKRSSKELFNFLNLFLKLPDRHVLGGDVLKQVVDDADKAMETALKEDPVGITLTFDEWTNIKNEQLLGTVLLSSEGKPYV
ncbi:hypothetical protein GLOIN_2v1885672 [Rhizophagus clarus]|uniref:Uncharacterized protein n=1 Tax=Rhizophagus clarus TaxID=94130 RepID=A0A8H3R0C2_9GLOM|nr:hypothetical protein GLOIN_2v1885672 [Rhizophagus clarus]